MTPPPPHLTESPGKTARDPRAALGLDLATGRNASPDPHVREKINIKLAALGLPVFGEGKDDPSFRVASSLIAHYEALNPVIEGNLCPADHRIMKFLEAYLGDVGEGPLTPLPGHGLVLDEHGLARELALPPDRDEYKSELVTSYRLRQGVLHNPASDRRTTKGVFHVCADGLPVPADKKEVPRRTYRALYEAALRAPSELMRLPFTATMPKPAEVWVTLLLRPVICPEVPGFTEEKSLEVRFFVPGSLVCNLEFVESIFGNAGDPFLPENDAALDVLHWSGHTGAVILAPHLVNLKKKDVGLPHVNDATDRQKCDGMCWENEDELYNDGGAFKLTCRDERGVVVTLIADNYFGYCKKEVKTMISFAANLYGLCEEEHAGGALAFASYDLGEEFRLDRYQPEVDHVFAEVLERYGDDIELQPEGYAVDKTYPDIYYVPEDALFALHDQTIRWESPEGEQVLKMLPDRTYVLPSGYRVEMMKPAEGRRWRLVGTRAEGTFCHKPCTVSGGGKSEISKPIGDAIIQGPVFVKDFQKDFDELERILNRDFSDIFADPERNHRSSRPILGPQRSLGSVIKLLTPSEDYTDEYNAWLHALPTHLKELVFILKRFWKPDWGDDWRKRFSVDVINGVPGNELKYRDRKLQTAYLRVGFREDGSWRIFGLRKDFLPALKLQEEDDISASVVVPADNVEGLDPKHLAPSVKFIKNCEYRLFQRPDDAIVRGYDKTTEAELSEPGNFLSNYEPLDREDAQRMVEDAIRFDQFTQPMQELIRRFAEDDQRPDFVACTANPRLVDGVPTKNPRFLETRPDLKMARERYLAETGRRLFRRLPSHAWVPNPVTAILPGRRNNPPEPGVKPLAVYNPIHYMELPELFMEYISSMTGKSPSTTGAGSEGALTKAPFNALLPVHDLNMALLAYILTDARAFLTAAGYVGPKYRVGHDVSLLVPEVWCRLEDEIRDPAQLIATGCLERCEDFDHEGQTLPFSRLGYRITQRFVRRFFGRIFSDPNAVFDEAMLAPEKQDHGIFVEGLETILATHELVARNYFEDGSIELAIPPLKALLHIMAHGQWEGKGLRDPEVRGLFDREAIIASDWYQARIDAFLANKERLWQRNLSYLQEALDHPGLRYETRRRLEYRMSLARQRLKTFQTPQYRAQRIGSLGREPTFYPGSA